MDISVSSLLYRDPPVTKAELMRAQQMIAPVNYPTNQDKVELSDNAKALAIKIAAKATKHESVRAVEAKE
ncbi:MAG: hypothetical protein FD143_2201 [Ignavibacteria bacterium]|nr:MAG: hypothetical protein FD143_2201 [Ignavibacteria bacterium]KAF0158676.1 MAG: hypothetical protein FD188_2483 [Ignavibacteria bacterium]